MAAFYFNTNISAFITILLKNRYGCLIMHIIIDELSMRNSMSTIFLSDNETSTSISDNWADFLTDVFD